MVNPSVNNGKFTDEEELELLNLFAKHGNKWKLIGEKLNGRTDNFIKNRYYSQVKVFLRRLNKISGRQRTVKAMASLRPSTLTKIFSIAEKLSFPADLNFKEFFQRILSLNNHNDISLSEELIAHSNNFIEEIFLLNDKLTRNKLRRAKNIKEIKKISSSPFKSSPKTQIVNKPEITEITGDNDEKLNNVNSTQVTIQQKEDDNLSFFQVDRSYFGSYSSQLFFNDLCLNRFEDSSIFQDFEKTTKSRKNQTAILNKEFKDYSSQFQREEELDRVLFN